MGFAAVDMPIERDRWDRPVIRDLNGENPTSYKRVTKYIDVIEDHYNLDRWNERNVAAGIAQEEHLRLGFLAAWAAGDKKTMNSLLWDAKKAAGADEASTKGTAVHSLTELIDRGQKLPGGLDPVHVAMVEAYAEATKGLKFTSIEQFLVHDKIQAAGTADRVAKVPGVGQPFIADLKTGKSIDFGIIKIAMQLAVYAHCSLYDQKTFKRKPLGVNANRAIIIHLPMVDKVEDVKCELHWVDIETGWQHVLLARQIHEAREWKFTRLTEPFEGKPREISLRKQKLTEDRAAHWVAVDRKRAENGIAVADSEEALRLLWVNYEHIWDDDLTALAKQAIEELRVKTDA